MTSPHRLRLMALLFVTLVEQWDCHARRPPLQVPSLACLLIRPRHLRVRRSWLLLPVPRS